ncbi:hypothetical protein GIB67_025422 [Kingdonia uniflora]|uniref:Uncharacterized protein n=1 Tax=Kingdonia uniflora TaxID=39325 RepID=A0A7J7NTU1_9MAGN|nr:hypothetical protein GIB67_025422 [Kingdonia uniflora]
MAIFRFICLLLIFCFGTARVDHWESAIKMPTMRGGKDGQEEAGTRWRFWLRVLPGSVITDIRYISPISNFGHQAHGRLALVAVQSGCLPCIPVAEKGGLKEENIVVFMYDDIANNELNPRPGVIIIIQKAKMSMLVFPRHATNNFLQSRATNLLTETPTEDYTGEQVTAKNLYAVLLGDKTAVHGGSGKVIDSKPNDRIFLYYSDHGGPGVLGMPNMPYLYGADLVEV